MATCDLCSTASDSLLRAVGLQLCERCHLADPTEALANHHIPAEWDTRLLRFSAGLGLPRQDPNFKIRFAPEAWHHTVSKLFVDEVQVGDPLFDDAVFVRTSNESLAREMLASEGVQSALLMLLSDTRPNELLASHVTLEGPTLTVSLRTNASLTAQRIQELQLATAALAIQFVKKARQS